MKQPYIKHTWVDDENHPLKGYPQDELEFVEENDLENFTKLKKLVY